MSAEPGQERTGGRVVDCVVEVGGTGTLGRSFQAVAPEGKIGLIGVLTDADENPNPQMLMQRRGHPRHLRGLDRPPPRLLCGHERSDRGQ